MLEVLFPEFCSIKVRLSLILSFEFSMESYHTLIGPRPNRAQREYLAVGKVYSSKQWCHLCSLWRCFFGVAFALILLGSFQTKKLQAFWVEEAWCWLPFEEKYSFTPLQTPGYPLLASGSYGAAEVRLYDSKVSLKERMPFGKELSFSEINSPQGVVLGECFLAEHQHQLGVELLSIKTQQKRYLLVFDVSSSGGAGDLLSLVSDFLEQARFFEPEGNQGAQGILLHSGRFVLSLPRFLKRLPLRGAEAFRGIIPEGLTSKTQVEKGASSPRPELVVRLFTLLKSQDYPHKESLQFQSEAILEQFDYQALNSEKVELFDQQLYIRRYQVGAEEQATLRYAESLCFEQGGWLSMLFIESLDAEYLKILKEHILPLSLSLKEPLGERTAPYENLSRVAGLVALQNTQNRFFLVLLDKEGQVLSWQGKSVAISVLGPRAEVLLNFHVESSRTLSFLEGVMLPEVARGVQVRLPQGEKVEGVILEPPD